MNKLGRKKAMLYGLLLVAAVLGLLIDRLRATDEAGPASPGSARLTGGRAAATAVVRSAQDDVKGPSIARVFQTAGSRGSETQPVDAEPVRNAFAMTPKMQLIYEEASPAKKIEQARQAETEEDLRRKEMARFQSAHKLKGTSLLTAADGWALIDGKIVRIGERIDGFELKRVERYRVEFSKNDVTVTLSLPLPY